MIRIDLGLTCLALALSPLACGGESASDGSGGSGGNPSGGSTSGGSGGSTSGGSGGTTSGGAGGSTSGGSGGTGACGPMPGPMDCLVCGQLTSPICENGAWTCPPEVGCPDAGSCPSNQVPTVKGCLGCSDASSQLNDGIEAARKASSACGTAADCVLTGAGTACAGSCQVAVSKSGEAAFQAALSKLDADYCSGFVPVCGYSTPKCAVPTLECTGGSCEAKFN
ncbi:MAG: hypothetical protein IPM35_19000 [Myxococcales bacterium]|nr:hypothetical protein [Myxococcales bacterium]